MVDCRDLSCKIRVFALRDKGPYGPPQRKQRLASKSTAETATARHQLLQTLMPAAQGPPTLQVGGRGRKAQVAFLRLLKAHGWRTSLQAESSGACVRRKRRNRANQSLLPRKSPRKQNHRSVKPGETSGLPRQHGILLTPRNGNENLSTINGQAAPKDLGAVGGLPGGLVESTASTLKSNPEGQRQTSDQAKGATLGQSISRVLNGPGPPSRPVAGFQPPVAASGHAEVPE